VNVDPQEVKDCKVSLGLKVHLVALVLKENEDFLDLKESKAIPES